MSQVALDPTNKLGRIDTDKIFARKIFASWCDVMWCDVMWCGVMWCYAMLCYAMLCYAMLCYVMLCYVMLCYAMLCYAMLCYAMLCYIMLRYLYVMMQLAAPTDHWIVVCVRAIALTCNLVTPYGVVEFHYHLWGNGLAAIRGQVIAWTMTTYGKLEIVMSVT